MRRLNVRSCNCCCCCCFWWLLRRKNWPFAPYAFTTGIGPAGPLVTCRRNLNYIFETDTSALFQYNNALSSFFKNKVCTFLSPREPEPKQMKTRVKRSTESFFSDFLLSSHYHFHVFLNFNFYSIGILSRFYFQQSFHLGLSLKELLIGVPFFFSWVVWHWLD